jgi:Schlafen, AlbA_2
VCALASSQGIIQRVDSIFDVDFSELEPEHIEEFLRDVSGEGLTWEGKGTAPLTKLKSKIVAGVCGLANQLGGYFIVGAEEDKDAGTWTLPGIENDCREDTHDWLARILSRNLVDAPPFEIRSWKLKDDRVAAVIRVDQTAIPPCMTKDGLVYVRVVSETVKVKDPRMLADLVRKGEAARKDAEDKAVATLSLMIEGGALAGEEIDRFVLALAPTTVGIDYTGRIFTGSFKESLLVAATELEQSFVDERRDSVVEMHRDGYRVLRGTNRGSGYFTRCGTAWWRLSLLAPAQVEVLLRSTRSWLKLGGPPRPHCRL